MDSTGEPSPPLLELEDARIECPSGLLFDGIRCHAVGNRIALLGPWDALFRLLAGDGQLTTGTARIGGDPIPAAVAAGKVGVALHDVPFPARWKGLEYLIRSARLAGCGGSPERRVRGVVERLGLTRVAGRRLQGMAPAERRAILVAHATVADPEILALEAPLDDLDHTSAGSLAVVIERAVQGRRLIVSVRDAAPGSPSRPLLDTADSILALDPRGQVTRLRTGDLPPVGGRRYVVAVSRQAGPFAAELERRGIHVERLETGPDSPAPPVVVRRELGEQPGRFVVRLGAGLGTDAILDASLALNVSILHLAPAEPAVTGEQDGERC